MVIKKGLINTEFKCIPMCKPNKNFEIGTNWM